MTEDRRKPAPDAAGTEDADEAPEARNTSQDDAPEQAQTLADELLGVQARPDTEDSERVPASDADLSDDDGSRPDLIDHMGQMVSDGRIDMGAYRGERNDDDVEQGLGPQGVDDETPRGIE